LVHAPSGGEWLALVSKMVFAIRNLIISRRFSAFFIPDRVLADGSHGPLRKNGPIYQTMIRSCLDSY